MKLKTLYNQVLAEKGELNEASLSRLISKTSNNDFCIATAFRSSNTLKQNRQLNKELIGNLNSKQMGAYMLIGHWQEAPDDVEFEDATPDQLSDSIEESVMFVRPEKMSREDFSNFCFEIAKKYNQDAVLVGLNGEGIFLYFKTGTDQKIGNKLTLNKTGQAYSQMRNKKSVPFIFEGVLQPTNNISKQVFKNENLKY